ncbi:MAG: TetR/AcrR family transcriptional regulator [Sphingomonadales bacterium]
MARPREFSIEETLDKAIHVFWSKGYEGASVNDLTATMGLSKSSFYDTFGSKRELFLSTLDHYAKTPAARRAASLIAAADSPKDGIAAAFAYFIDNLLSGREIRGCYANSSAAEITAPDPEVAKRVMAAFGQLEQALFNAVVDGQLIGQISRSQEPVKLARFLCASINGLIVLGKTAPPREALEGIVQVALSVLD